MKAFLSGVTAMVLIAAAAWLVLGQVDMAARDVYTRGSVRL